jgi:hypothetical protein
VASGAQPLIKTLHHGKRATVHCCYWHGLENLSIGSICSDYRTAKEETLNEKRLTVRETPVLASSLLCERD